MIVIARQYLSRKIAILVLSLTFAIVALLPMGAAHAADNKWINQVWSKYTSYNKATVASYNRYMANIEAQYKQFYKDSHEKFDELYNIIQSDQDMWEKKLDEDLVKLRDQYDNNRDKLDELRAYERAINRNMLGTAMGKYDREGNKNMLGTTMGVLDRAMNENLMSSLMWKYNNTINENYLSSSAWRLERTVNENYLSSPMWKLRNESNSNYLGSTMWNYEHGRISKKTAQARYAASYKNLTTQIYIDSTRFKQEIASTAKSVNAQINELYLKSLAELESQREESLKEVSECRKALTGEGITWTPLLLDSNTDK